MDDASIYIKKELERLMREAKSSRCLHPNQKECSKKVIKAHSIQNNRILNKISENGMVVSPTGSKLSLESDFASTGRKSATTFEGFCSKHDHALFQDIEEKEYMPKNLKQELLFAYRILCREIITKECFKNLCINMFKEGMIVHPDIVLGAEQALKDMENLKKSFDEILSKEKFEEFQTDLIILEDEYLFAVSSAFFIEYDFKNNPINELNILSKEPATLFLTIFPQNKKTYVLISYLKKDNLKFSFLKKQLLDLSEEEKKRRISSMICLYCENFVMSPKKWREFDESIKGDFVREFYESICEEKKGLLDIDFNLFI